MCLNLCLKISCGSIWRKVKIGKIKCQMEIEKFSQYGWVRCGGVKWMVEKIKGK